MDTVNLVNTNRAWFLQNREHLKSSISTPIIKQSDNCPNGDQATENFPSTPPPQPKLFQLKGDETPTMRNNPRVKLKRPTSCPPPPPPSVPPFPQVEEDVKTSPKQSLPETTNPSPEHHDAIGALMNAINLRKVSESEKQKPLTDQDRLKAALDKRLIAMLGVSDDENEPRPDPEGDWNN